MAGLIILAEPIIKVFFEGGAFDYISTVMTAKALVCYSFGLWAFAGIRVVVSAFYALQDTKTPVRIAVVAMVCNLFLSLVLMGPLAHRGLALALSISSTIQFILLSYCLKRRSIVWAIRPVLSSILKSLFISIIMGIVIYFIYFGWLDTHISTNTLFLAPGLLGVIFIGAIVYFLLARILGCSEVFHILDMINPFKKQRHNALNRK